jgi:hypothetical protein
VISLAGLEPATIGLCLHVADASTIGHTGLSLEPPTGIEPVPSPLGEVLPLNYSDNHWQSLIGEGRLELPPHLPRRRALTLTLFPALCKVVPGYLAFHQITLFFFAALPQYVLV